MPSDYFRIHRANDNSFPLLDPDSGCLGYLYERKAIEKPKPLKFKFGQPIPKKPKMGDYLPSPYSIVSKKIYDVLDSMDIKSIQLLPSIIRDKDNKTFNDYWAIHVFQTILCIDTAKSDCEIEDFSIENVNKIVLDKKALTAVPLQKRLIFRLEEDIGYELYHKTIVDAIMKTKPEGVKFTDIEKWNESSFFGD